MPNVTTDSLNPSTLIRPDPAKVARAEARAKAQRSSDNAAGHGGKTPAEVQLLKVLRNDGPVESVAMLAKDTGLASTEVSHALSDLEARGLVRRSEHGSLGFGGSRIEAVI